MTALIRKRAEIAGQIEAAQDHMRQLVIDLDHVDATIRIYRPDIDLEEIRPKPLPPRHQAFRGQSSRFILDTLKARPDGMTTREVAKLVIENRGLNPEDKGLSRTIVKRIGASLKDMRNKGLVQSEQGPGSFNLWRVAR
ncbi:MAG: hypothetical protein ACFCUT_20530 [Kiloniellaceae bacterium]